MFSRSLCRPHSLGRFCVPARVLTFFTLLILGAGQLRAAPENQLADHSSPYLAMHGQDPVAWQLWGEHVFERARRENKLVYVSIGYFSCHWCHVMQRESYQDEKIAALLNEHFVPVKVDRELQPALDARLIDFVERTRGYSGWPLNVFITPQGYPLVGIVYLPPEEFSSLLVKLQRRWNANARQLGQVARQASEAMSSTTAAQTGKLNAEAVVRLGRAFVEHALKQGDELEGGFGGPNKFPSVPQMMGLLEACKRQPRERLREFLTLTLDHMMNRGLRDQLRGGFFRYVVDPGWSVPHFEKMLYDNALLAELYLKAAAVLDNRAYLSVARGTLDFMLRELDSPKGGMIASLSAVDDQGVEGGYYLWSEEELQRLLTEQERRVARTAWNMQPPPPVAHGFLPNQISSPDELAGELGMTAERIAQLLDSARDKLLAAQRARSLPKDRKRLAGWNGLALRALTRGARVFGDQRYRAAARETRNFLVNELWDGEHLVRARTPTRVLGNASLEDYAYVASGLLTWAEYADDAGDGDYRVVSRIVDTAWEEFYNDGVWSMGGGSLVQYGAAEPVLADGPMPSPSAVLVRTSLQLPQRYRDPATAARARGALAQGLGLLEQDPFWFATQITTIAVVSGGAAGTAREP